MKSKKFLSFLAVALITLISVSLTSCGSEDGDPTPTPPTKTDLEKVKENIIGVEIHTIKAEVGGVIVTDLCAPGAQYENSVEDLTFTFTDGTTVHVDYECTGGETDLNYSVTQTGDVFTILAKSKSSGSTVVNALFNKSDLINSSGQVLTTVKGTFQEIASPKNWVGSPLVTLERKN